MVCAFSSYINAEFYRPFAAELPSTIDLEKFVEVRRYPRKQCQRDIHVLNQARAFEINAMHNAMKTARSALHQIWHVLLLTPSS